MWEEFDSTVYACRKDRYGHVDYIIKIPHDVVRRLGLKHKDRVKVRISKS